MEASGDELARFFEVVLPHLNELQRRVVAGAMAEALGRGGKSAVAEASGMSRNTVIKAEREVSEGIEPSERQRAPGGGDIKSEDKQPGLLEALDELVHPETRGNPMSYLRWTSKSTGNLATELVRQGYKITDDTVGRILQLHRLLAPGPLQAKGGHRPPRSRRPVQLPEQGGGPLHEGGPARDQRRHQEEGDRGRVLQRRGRVAPRGEPTRTKTHDFVDKELGRAVPYGVYDLANDEGWVSVGDTADTASFAVEAIRRWWYSMGQPRFPGATKLLITADAGGSNGYRVKLWKVELAKLAQEIGLEITVVHYPPGTSKWNRIEHRMFSFISMNWRGRPLVSYRTIVELISNTTTAKGLRIRAEEDLNYYETGTKVSAAELAAVPLSPHKFHGDWNYTIAQSVNR